MLPWFSSKLSAPSQGQFLLLFSSVNFRDEFGK